MSSRSVPLIQHGLLRSLSVEPCAPVLPRLALARRPSGVTSFGPAVCKQRLPVARLEGTGPVRNEAIAETRASTWCAPSAGGIRYDGA